VVERDLPGLEYGAHSRVQLLLDLLLYSFEDVSLSFDRWDEPYVKGPGLYVAVVAGTSLGSYADPMGDNRFPVETCRNAFDSHGALLAAAREVSVDRDGAAVVTVDGEFYEQMVRFKYRPNDEVDDGVEYADWMGSRHMSAVDTSARDEVIAALTLSEETGRVTVFRDGAYEDYTRAELGGLWRAGN
jgi:hypothetical protein